MDYLTNDRPHHVWHGSYGVTFWNGNTAGNADNATCVVVSVGTPGMPYPEFTFKWPEQKREAEKLEAALATAFERGAYAAKAEIRRILGVKE